MLADLGPRPIDLGNPVSDHPLNRGLQVWLIGLPNTPGGAFLRDIGPHAKFHAALDSATLAPSLIRSPEIKGPRFSSANTSNASVYVDSVLTADGPCTFTTWVRFNAAVANDEAVIYAGGGFGAGAEVYVYRANTTGYLTENGVAGSTAVTSNVWHFVAYTQDATTRRIYLDGFEQANGSTPEYLFNTSIFLNARNVFGTKTAYSDCNVTDVRGYNRCLSAGELLALYRDALAGHPDTIRRYAPRVWAFGGVAAGGGATNWTYSTSDGLGLSDAVARTATSSRSASDGIGLSDAAARLVNSSRSASDGTGLSDAAARFSASSRSASDGIGLSDAAARFSASFRLVQDLLGITDLAVALIGSVITRLVVDSIGLQDSATRLAASRRLAADNFGAHDVLVRSVAALRALTDSAGIPDSAARSAAYDRAVQDGLSLADRCDRVVEVFRGVVDSVDADDLVSLLIQASSVSLCGFDMHGIAFPFDCGGGGGGSGDGYPRSRVVN